MKTCEMKIVTFLLKVINISLLLTFSLFVIKGPMTKFFSGKTKFEVKEVDDLHAPFPMLAICKLPGYKSKERPFVEIAKKNEVRCIQ